MAKRPTITIDDIRFSDPQAFRRTQWFETAKTIIQIVLMSILVLALTTFLVLLIIAGVTQNILAQTDGVQALSKLFVEVAANAKTVVLFALGFFFREYLNARNIADK